MPFEEKYAGDVLYLTVPSFSETGLVRHGFTTRLGGVSAPPYDKMNLRLYHNDDLAVHENYKIIGDALGIDSNRLIFFPQVHKNDIFVAQEADAGMGFRKGRPEYDGIITNVKNLPLATFHADCTPIFLLDPVKKVAGVVHAGWRGTALMTVGCAITKMHEVFGSNPQDILAGIGPCGGICCYETDRDVPDAMIKSLGSDAQNFIVPRGHKWHIDLAGLNSLVLKKHGVLPQNVTISGICTCCEPDKYWSHRKTGGVRGAMAAIIMLV